MPIDAAKHMSSVLKDTQVQIVFEPRPEGPAPYAGPIDIEVDKESIPITASIDLGKYLGDDTDPCSVVAKIPVGWSFNGYYLAESAVQAIVEQVKKWPLSGSRGHAPKNPEADNFSYPEINVVYVGAVYDESRRAGYLRGYIDPAYPELKRHVRSGLVNRVSTDLLVTEAQATSDGGIAITDCLARSLDFAPRLKNAFDQGVVAQDMIQEDKTSEVINPMNKDEKHPIEDPKPEGEQLDPTSAAEETLESETTSEPTELEVLVASLGADDAARVARLKALLTLDVKAKQDEADALRGQVLKDMIADEDVRALIGRMVPMQPDYDYAKYQVVVKDMLNDPVVQKALSKRADTVFRPSGGANSKNGLAIEVRYNQK